MKKKEKIFLWIIVSIGLFLCFFRLKETQLLIHDTARDTLRVLEIWQTKEVTLVGPPASFSLVNADKFYFGSMPYYLALIGMLATKFSPVGAVLPTIALYLFSIPVIFLFFKNIKASKLVTFLGVVLYAVSPLTITHMRFFWNPNTIIPLSVFYWYLVTVNNKAKSFEINFLAGIIAAIIFNFHYFAVIPIIVWWLISATKRKWDDVLGNIMGFLIGTSPLFVYELQNNFYLTKTLVYDLSHKAVTGTFGLMTFVGRLGEVFMAVLGIKAGEISFGTLFQLNQTGYWIVEVILLILFALVVYRLRKSSNLALVLPLAVTLVFAAYFSDTAFYTRYAFGAFPLIIWMTAQIFEGKYQRYLLIPVFALIVYSLVQILSFTPSLKTGYISLSVVEKIGKKIVSENPQGKYNLSENIYVDAQAMALRFFVQKDAGVKPQKIDEYGWLNTLYVVSPSLEKIKSENRWEYTASGPWSEPQIINFGEVNLYKFKSNQY